MANFRDPRVYLVHLVRVLHERGPAAPSDIYDAVADRLGLSRQERDVLGGPRNLPVYRSRIRFARQALTETGVMIGSSDTGWQRGQWQLSSDGLALAKKIRDDEELDRVLREQTSEARQDRRQQRKESRALAGISGGAETEADEEPPDDADDDEDVIAGIRESVDDANETVLTQMLDHVRGMNDTAFEHLVGTVLKAALRAESVQITQQSRDGGIDGVLLFDALGMRSAVFEAKRYGEGSMVSRPQIDAFATAFRRRRAAHALFVTSGEFSRDAIEAAKHEGIRLIDGRAFVELMARHGIGFRAREEFVVYEFDPAWSVDVEDGG